jgi:pilus assembly protein Flp/PilA
MRITMYRANTAAIKLGERLTRRKDDAGQTAAEYVGILVVVGAIFAVVVAANLPNTVQTSLTTAISQIFGGGGAAGGGGAQ